MQQVPFGKREVLRPTPGGKGRRSRHSRLPRGWGGGACLGPRHFQCGGPACTRGAESTKRRGHQNSSQQNSAVSRRQSRQGCSQSAEGCGTQEIYSVKEIGSAEVKRGWDSRSRSRRLGN